MPKAASQDNVKTSKALLSSMNLLSPDRKVRHTTMTPKLAKALPPVDLSSNQYSKEDFSGNIEASYVKLLQQSVVVMPKGVHEKLCKEHPLLEPFFCWVPEGSGVDVGKEYRRCNFLNKKTQCHVLTYVYVSPGLSLELEHDISHTCGNGHCSRVVHLTEEPRGHNIDRRKCVGYIYDVSMKHLYRFCEHSVPCKRVHVVENMTSRIVKS